MKLFEELVSTEAIEDFGGIINSYDQFDGDPRMVVGGAWPDIEYTTYRVHSKRMAFLDEGAQENQITEAVRALFADIEADSTQHPPEKYKIAWRVRPQVAGEKYGCQHCVGQHDGAVICVSARCRLAFVLKEEYL